MNKFLEFIMISGITIITSLIFMLVKSKKKELHFKLLTLFFITLLSYLLIGYADLNEFNILILLTFPIVDNIEFILGPLLYFYVEALFNYKKRISKKDMLHFIPATFYLIVFTVPEIISFFRETYIFKYLHLLDNYSNLIYLLLILYLITYTAIAKLKFNKYQKIHKANYASSAVENIVWVNHLLIGVLIVCAIDFMVELLVWVFNFKNETYYITVILAALFIIYLGYYGINQTKILLPEGSIDFKNKNIKPTEIITLKKQLEQLLDQDKIYRDENLNLQILADKMNINKKKLSYSLNHHLNTNFYELINKKRVDDVKQKMESEDYQNHTLIEIAYEAGFQSKASFNRIFKKETNLSPTQYKKNVRNKTH